MNFDEAAERMARSMSDPMQRRDSRSRFTAEIVADLLGVTRSTVSSYASRGQMPKPSPCPCCGHPTWDAQEIRTWAANRPGRIGRPKK